MPELEELLDRVTEGVLETMFFSAVLGAGGPPASDEPLTALVEFSGSIQGVLGLSADRTTVLSHTASLLGVAEAEAPDDEAPAVIGELANVICGVMLPHLCSTGEFRIAPPRIYTDEYGVGLIEGMPVLRRFELAEGGLSVGLSVGNS
jgi:CheY-specific phosphatase CheX